MKTRRGSEIMDSENDVTNEPMNVTSLTITWGKEVLRPLEFHSIEIGGYQLTVTPSPEESLQDLADRAMRELDAIAEKEFPRKIDGFLDRTRRLHARMVAERDKTRDKTRDGKSR